MADDEGIDIAVSPQLQKQAINQVIMHRPLLWMLRLLPRTERSSGPEQSVLISICSSPPASFHLR